ncbi:MAG: DsrE family protein [Bacillota bacterium]
MDKMKVLFHVNEPERWQRTLLNIINFLNDAGQENVDVEVIANGAAVSAYANKCQIKAGSETANSCGIASGDLLEQINNLTKIGVKFVACRNSLRMKSLDENMIQSYVTVVSAGITEIVKKQAEGYAYIKP